MDRLAPALLLALAACGGAAPPRATTPDAAADGVKCQIYVAGGEHRALVLAFGESGTVTLRSLTLRGVLERYGLGLWATVGEKQRQVFRGSYPIGEVLPENLPRQTGFTGLLFLSDDGGGAYQVMCHSIVDPRVHQKHEQRHRARVAKDSRDKAALWATLYARGPCPATATAGSATCPPAHPLAERVAAMLSLHGKRVLRYPSIDLPGADLAGVDLRDSDLGGADLTGAKLTGAQLYFVDLQYARLDGADLSRADVYSADLLGASLKQARLVRAKLENAELDNATLTGADLTHAYLERASFTGARLDGATLSDGYLAYANLHRADLRGADLARAKLKGAVLDGADLSSAWNLTQAQLDNACGDADTRLPDGLTIRRRPRFEFDWADHPPCSTAETTGRRTRDTPAPIGPPEHLVLAPHYAALFERGHRWQFQVRFPAAGPAGQAELGVLPAVTVGCEVERVEVWEHSVGARIECRGEGLPRDVAGVVPPGGVPAAGDWVANADGLWRFGHEVLDGPEPELDPATRVIAAAPVESETPQAAVGQPVVRRVRYNWCVTRVLSDETGRRVSHCFAAKQGLRLAQLQTPAQTPQTLRLCMATFCDLLPE